MYYCFKQERTRQVINNNLFSGSQFQQQQSGGYGSKRQRSQQQDQFAGSQAALQQQQALQFGNQFQQQPQASSGLSQHQRVSGGDSFSLKSTANVTPFSGASVQSQKFKPPSFGAVTQSEGPNKSFKSTQSPQAGDPLSQFRQQLNSGQLQFRGALPYTATQSWNA